MKVCEINIRIKAAVKSFLGTSDKRKYLCCGASHRGVVFVPLVLMDAGGVKAVGGFCSRSLQRFSFFFISVETVNLRIDPKIEYISQ